MTTLVPPLLITTRHRNLLRDWQAVPRVGDWIDLPFAEVSPRDWEDVLSGEPETPIPTRVPCVLRHRVVEVEWSDAAVTIEAECVGAGGTAFKPTTRMDELWDEAYQAIRATSDGGRIRAIRAAIEAEACQQEPALDVERLAQAMHELHKGPCTRWQYPEHRASYIEDALIVAAEYTRLATEDKR